MPLTQKGKKVIHSMTETYGNKKKAESVLYAMKNCGKLKGIDHPRGYGGMGGSPTKFRKREGGMGDC